MAEPLGAADFALAFTFSRSEPVSLRGPDGALTTAAPDVPAFDHLPDGTPLGLLTGGGEDLGGADRVELDPLMLPADMIGGDAPGAREVTVLHWFDDGTGEARRAWYSRDALATVAALLGQEGHHRALGVVPGHLRNDNGVVRYRGESWTLPELIAASAGTVLADDDDRPVIRAGA